MVRRCATLKPLRHGQTPDQLEAQSLIDNDGQLPTYHTGSLQHISTAVSEESSSLETDSVTTLQKFTHSRPFTKQVLLIILSYGILAYHTITFDQLLPLLLSTPDPKDRLLCHLNLLAATSRPYPFDSGNLLHDRNRLPLSTRCSKIRTIGFV